ncbi:hypothetical protein H4218_002062 [Coemansia sp. IMI 209128]|nr:hypothetical protein GGI10_003590 [Coemansia sp. RSA 2530]KAJ2700329.1 hypothetical protein H4218_002062 [Coemansia sp. IMI 209128]
MDINDIFKESVSSKTLMPSKSKRKLGATPGLRTLKEGGYGIANASSSADGVDGEPAKRVKRSESDSADDGADDDDDADDEGGRFFSDGLTTDEKGVMTWVDNMEIMDDALDQAAVQRMVVRLERAVSKNTEDRIKHANSPQLFAESEADLDEALQRLLLLANDVQYLGVLEDLGALSTLVGLMAHENADITLDVIQFVVEVTAEDAWSHEGESTEERELVSAFVRALAAQEFFEVLGQNLRRLKEDSDSFEGEADRMGVFQSLSLVENIVSLDSTIVSSVVSAMDLLEWLRARITQSVYSRAGAKRSTTTQADPNQQYAAELVSILLHSNWQLRIEASSGQLGLTLMECLAKYKKLTPEDEVEMEYLENIVDSICMMVSTRVGKNVFVEAEGVELLLVLQQQQQHVARLLSLKILDYAMSPAHLDPDSKDDNGDDAAQAKVLAVSMAKRYIENRGLKYLFSILMHQGKGGVQRLYKKYPETDERAVSCLASLLRLTSRDSPERWRLLAKFASTPTDGSSWKLYIDRIVELNIEYFECVQEVEAQSDSDSESEADPDSEMERYSQRLEAGLFSLQMTDIVVAFVAEDPKAREYIELRLKRKGRTLAMVAEELAEYVAVREETDLQAAPRRQIIQRIKESHEGPLTVAHMLDHI